MEIKNTFEIKYDEVVHIFNQGDHLRIEFRNPEKRVIKLSMRRETFEDVRLKLNHHHHKMTSKKYNQMIARTKKKPKLLCMICSNEWNDKHKCPGGNNGTQENKDQ